MTLTGNWNYPTTVRFGEGRLTQLGEICQEVQITCPLIVTDPGLAKHPMVAQAKEAITQAGLVCDVFSAIKSNPTDENVMAGVEFLKSGDFDGVVALGGGSALDAGKAIALMARQTRPLQDFEDAGDNWMRADADAILPTIAIATTSGTGSDVGRASVITDVSAKVKKVIFHPKMMPVVTLADPALTLGLPPELTAATGMDALAHNLEAYCAPFYHPFARGIALEGMRLVKDWLPKAVAAGADLEARSHMMTASMSGATAFQRGLGAIHALSHPLGALYDAHHGLLNAVVMPYVLEANRPAIADDMAALARWLDLPRQDTTGVIDWVLGLREEIGIPHTLADIGIPDDTADQIGAMAIQDPTAGGNPIPFSADDYAMLFRNAHQGTL